jgi:glucosyl-dolichyl phosphate glucuronosyltransferase
LRLSVVICAYTEQRWDDLVAAVTSVERQTHPVHEIVVVVDYNDSLLTRARAHLGAAHVVRNAEAKGLSGARNTGWRLASGEVVAFLDDDARAAPEWACRMLAAYLDDDVVGAGGAVIPEWRAPRPAWLPEEFLWVVGCGYRGQPTQRAAVRNAIGANMSFRREVLVATGGFQVGLGRQGADVAGCEETELSIRAHATRRGGKIVLDPDAVVRHAVTAERTTRSYFRRRCIGEGRSKAMVAALVGSGAALGSERGYAARVLPAGCLHGIAAFVRGDRYGLQRACAIVEGLALTVFGYLAIRTRRRRGATVRSTRLTRRAGSRVFPGRGSASLSDDGPGGGVLGPPATVACRNLAQSHREQSVPRR